jgi:hypothetical protein
MAQAPLSLSIRQRQAIPVLALQSARRAVKRKLQAQGIKLALVPAAQITRLAEEYAAANRASLVAEAARLAVRIFPARPPNGEVFGKIRETEHSHSCGMANTQGIQR